MAKVVRTHLLIQGMRDNACRERLAAVLERVRGVKQVDVSLFRARAIVVHDESCQPAALFRAVAEAGYEVASVRPD